jgi:hypothetical protein
MYESTAIVVEFMYLGMKAFYKIELCKAIEIGGPRQRRRGGGGPAHSKAANVALMSWKTKDSRSDLQKLRH